MIDRLPAIFQIASSLLPVAVKGGFGKIEKRPIVCCQCLGGQGTKDLFRLLPIFFQGVPFFGERFLFRSQPGFQAGNLLQQVFPIRLVFSAGLQPTKQPAAEQAEQQGQG